MASLCHRLALWPQADPFPFALTPSNGKAEPSPFAFLQTLVISFSKGKPRGPVCAPPFSAAWKHLAAEQQLETSLGGRGKGLPSKDSLVSPILPSPGSHHEPQMAFFGGGDATPFP